MSISTAFFVSPCLILFCIICSICKWQNKYTETETETERLSTIMKLLS